MVRLREAMSAHTERSGRKTYEAESAVEHQKQPAAFHRAIRRFQGFKHTHVAAPIISHSKINANR